jgi:dehydrogenase/reductase SDR family protein 12
MSWSRWIAAAADRVLDPSIVLSFDRSGFSRHQRGFFPGDLDVDMGGRVCAITGANSGIGLATARALAARGAEVWMLCRNAERGEKARAEVEAQTNNANVRLAIVDVSDVEKVKRFARDWPVQKLDVLVHNAGALFSERAVNPQGLELTLATNLVGPLALMAGLVERLSEGHLPRVIWVSSGGMYTQKLRVDHLANPPGTFDGVKAYATTKRAMVVLSEQLAERLGSAGIAVHCMHPGWADTPGVQSAIPGFWRVTRGILRTAAQGADTVIWLAVCDRAQVDSGRFWFDRKPRPTHLLPGTCSDASVRDELWEEAHRWAGLDTGFWATLSRSIST